jgi:hypothetical protein
MSANSNTYIVGDYSSEGVVEVIAGDGIIVSGDRVYPIVSTKAPVEQKVVKQGEGITVSDTVDAYVVNQNSFMINYKDMGAFTPAFTAGSPSRLRFSSPTVSLGKSSRWLITYSILIPTTGWSSGNSAYIYYHGGSDNVEWIRDSSTYIPNNVATHQASIQKNLMFITAQIDSTIFLNIDIFDITYTSDPRVTCAFTALEIPQVLALGTELPNSPINLPIIEEEPIDVPITNFI